MAIIDATTWKTLKGVTDTTYDALLAIVIPSVIAQVQTYTGRTLERATFTEKQDGCGSPTLILKNYPITALTSVTWTNPAGTSVSIPTTILAYEANSGVLKFDPPRTGAAIGRTWDGFVTSGYGYPADVWSEAVVFPKGEQNVTVVYTAGYTTGTYPADLQLAMYQWVDVQMSTTLVGVGNSIYKHERLGKYDYDKGDGFSDNYSAMFRALFGPFRRAIS